VDVSRGTRGTLYDFVYGNGGDPRDLESGSPTVMALVIQTEPAVGSFVPYERPPQNLTLWSAIPRGLQSFILDVAVLDLIAVNDDALLNITATLPPNFGYVMHDLNLTLAQTAAGTQWIPVMNLNLQNFYRAPGVTGLNGNWTQTMRSAAQDSTTMSMEKIQPWPSFPLIGTPSTSGVLINVSTFNNAKVARPAGTINFYISFWQFDLEQIRKFPINSPIPTQAR